MFVPNVETSPPFDITRASHVRYLVSDLDESLRFYTEVLGFVLSDREGKVADVVLLPLPFWRIGIEMENRKSRGVAYKYVSARRTSKLYRCQQLTLIVYAVLVPDCIHEHCTTFDNVLVIGLCTV